jgi:BirA family transcriptional regulator, biotin operon repressor / biotin---[acetyl-CoA-carboxylase] ligase
VIGRTRWRFGSVDSTQNVAFRLAELGAAHGTVVRAAHQSAGRGRQGRSWDSGRGSSLMFSALLRPEQPPHQLGDISILVADVLAGVFAERTPDPVEIKWPNDVMISDRKTSGILLQARSDPAAVAVLGIGINIDSPEGSLPGNGTSLRQHMDVPIDGEELLEAVLDGLNSMWAAWRPELDPRQIERLESRLWQLGREVSILDADREIRGRILGLASSGGLRLSVHGEERTVMVGEITRGPRPIDREISA